MNQENSVWVRLDLIPYNYKDDWINGKLSVDGDRPHRFSVDQKFIRESEISEISYDRYDLLYTVKKIDEVGGEEINFVMEIHYPPYPRNPRNPNLFDRIVYHKEV